MDRRSLLIALTALFVTPRAQGSAPEGVLRRVLNDPEQRYALYLFVAEVFGLYPPARFQAALVEAAARYPDDESIYTEVASKLPALKPLAADLTHSLPSLLELKREMVKQEAVLLGDVDRVEGYLEIGSTGRYYQGLTEIVSIEGPVWVLNDVAPGFSPVDLLERGRLARVGTFLQLGDYADPAEIPARSVDLITCHIGLHHCPPGHVEGFVTALRRVLRPGGRLIVREHDAHSGRMNDFVGAVHDVFNVGVGLSWDENASQIRAFRGLDEWVSLFERSGFRKLGHSLLQPRDPTLNTLVNYVKV